MQENRLCEMNLWVPAEGGTGIADREKACLLPLVYYFSIVSHGVKVSEIRNAEMPVTITCPYNL